MKKPLPGSILYVSPTFGFSGFSSIPHLRPFFLAHLPNTTNVAKVNKQYLKITL